MKFNTSLIQLIIRLLILSILFVVLFMLSLTLYSTKFWPDVYKYVNANITIKKIPTLTEINCEVYNDDVTEIYNDETTTEGFDEDITTTTFEFDDVFGLDNVDIEVEKRSIVETKDYSEVPTKAVVIDYFFDLGDGNLVKNLISESEFTTRVDDVEMLAGIFGMKERSMEASNIDEELSSSVFPWIAAIFVKNNTSDEFSYYCDGALLSERAVLTAARCVLSNNSTVNSDDLLIIFGKKSLKIMTDAEKIARVARIIVHGDFVAPKAGSDLAILVMEEPVIFSDNIQAVSLRSGEIEAEYIATSGWQTTGELTPILLKSGDKDNCEVESTAEDTVCAVYGDDITVCPSYGGLYVTKQDTWYLQGLRTGDPNDRGLCFNRNVAFTSLDKHWQWIKDNME